METTDLEPVAVAVLDLDEPLGELVMGTTASGERFPEALALVRVHGDPLGTVRVPLRDGCAPREQLAAVIAGELADALARHGAAYGCLGDAGARPVDLYAGLRAGPGGCPGDRPLPDPPPSVDVIVPTAGRPGPLAACVESLRQLEYPRFRIVVVDNRPDDDGATRAVVEALAREDDRIRYLAEPRPGSSVARNRGVAESNAEIVAFTDDDVCVDPRWLAWLVHGFASDPEVTVVTGLVMPTDMATPAQRRFEEWIGFGKGYTRRAFDLHEHRAPVPLFPFWGATFGSGNNMAFRRSALVALGGFDPALGVGSRAMAGADIESFTHAILAGGRLVYEPRSLCRHDHRSDESALERQLFGYWVGFTAILTKWALRRPAGLGLALIRALPEAAGPRRGSGAPRAREVERFREQLRMSAGRSLLGLQLKGYLLGPIMYVRSSLWARRLGLRSVLTETADTSRASSPAHTAVAVRTVDVGAPLTAVELDGAGLSAGYGSLLLIARLGERPVGVASLTLGPSQRAEADVVAAAIREQLGQELAAALASRGEHLPATLPLEGLGAGPDDDADDAAPTFTVVVPTCRNPDKLERCLRSIFASDYDRFDVVVVENRPGSPITSDMLERSFPGEQRLRYVEEPTAGAARARNRGLAEATGEFVAFVDDDVIVDPAWLRMARIAFGSDDEVGCVTGLILPLSLDSPARVLREQLASFGKGFRPLTFSLPETRGTNPLFPYTPGHVGSGANTLIRTDLARQLGGFDVRLGPATPTLGGCELDLYIRVLNSGADIRYEPGVVVWHDHPDDIGDLNRYAFRFGVGLGAMLTKQLTTGPERLRLLRLVPAGIHYALSPSSRKNAGKAADYPRRLDLFERLGMVAGPPSYLASVLLTADGRHGGRAGAPRRSLARRP